MKKIISLAISLAMCASTVSAFAADKDAPAITESGYKISLSSYNLRSNGTKSADVTVTNDGEIYTGDIKIAVDGTEIEGNTVSSTIEGIHNVTAEVDGETLTTYFAYVHQYGACAVKDKQPVFFEDFEDNTYSDEGAADLLDVTQYKGSLTSAFKTADAQDVGNRPGKTALQFHTSNGEAFQSAAIGPELQDYAVDFYFRGQNYIGSNRPSSVMGLQLGLRADTETDNAYKVLYAPYAQNGSSTLTGGSSILDVLALGRSYSDDGYYFSKINTSASARSYASDESDVKIPLTDNYGFAENKFYKMSALAFSDSLEASTYGITESGGLELLRNISTTTNDSKLIPTSKLTRGKTVFAAQAYAYRIDDVAIYKLYNCKNIYADDIPAQATAGEAIPVSVTLNGVDNNAVPQAVVNYKADGTDLIIYSEGLGIDVDRSASTVTFQNEGANIIPIEYIGANGNRKGFVKEVDVQGDEVFCSGTPVISISGNQAEAAIKVQNTTMIDHTAKVFLAVYANDGSLASVSVSYEESFAPNTADTMKAQLTLPSGYSSDSHYLKAFVWDDMAPLTVADL